MCLLCVVSMHSIGCELSLYLLNLKELKNASLDDLTSWVEKAKAEGRPTQKLEKWLLHRYCFEGVSSLCLINLVH